MTCRDYEPLLALYVEGDLEDRSVERHLGECGRCREMLEDLRTSQAMLKDLAETADPVFLSAVRTGVLSRTRRRRVWPWVAACTAAAVLVALIPAPRKPSPSLAVAANRPDGSADGGADPPVRGRPPGRPSAPVHKGRRGRRPQTRGSAPPVVQPLVVKMFTDDPNIVIIWLVDQPGD